MRWLALWVFVLGLTGCAPAEAQSCSRNCPVSEMDAQGCCPAKANTSGSGAKPVSPGRFGQRATSAGCKTGLVNEGGACCWPGQGWTGSACVGTPTCPDGLVASGDTCAAPGCPSGQVKQSGGQCCWPGQVWSSSGGKCVGTAQCPAGFEAEGDASCVSLAAVAAREAAAREAAAREAAARAPADWTSPTLGVFKGVPGGTFMLGNTQVTLSRGFWVMEHEVTQGEWRAVMGGNPSDFSSCGRDCPVEQVSWEDAQGFVSAVSRRDGVSYRLLTEAEWEWAARGGASFAYAGSDNLDAVGWYDGNSGDTTHPVCRKQRNGYGLCDMSGNVWEWVADWYGGYPGGAVTDPTGAPSGSYRVIRGGSWDLDDPLGARVAHRRTFYASARTEALGFRLSRSVP